MSVPALPRRQCSQCSAQVRNYWRLSWGGMIRGNNTLRGQNAPEAKLAKKRCIWRPSPSDPFAQPYLEQRVTLRCVLVDDHSQPETNLYVHCRSLRLFASVLAVSDRLVPVGPEEADLDQEVDLGSGRWPWQPSFKDFGCHCNSGPGGLVPTEWEVSCRTISNKKSTQYSPSFAPAGTPSTWTRSLILSMKSIETLACRALKTSYPWE